MKNASNDNLRRVVLTHRVVETMKPELKAYRISDIRCPGLGIRVAVSGAKSWEAVYRIRGTPTVKRKALGSFPSITLEHARARAAALTSAAQAGKDLLEQEAQARAELACRTTVGSLIDEYIRRACGKLRTRHEISLRLKRALSSLSQKPAEEIKRRDLRRLLDAVSDRGAPREAEKQRQSIGAMFNWATSQDIVSSSPIRGLKAYSSGEARDRILSPDEIKIFWNWLDSADLTNDMADALRLQLCLGARIGETAGMRAEELNPISWQWTLPAARSKNKKARVTPIVGIARKILSERLRTVTAGPLFINETGAALRSNDVGSAIVTRRKRIPLDHFVSHDMRRTVATQLIEIGINYDIVAAVLGHEPGDRNTRTLVKHYVRSDLIPQKVVALEAWDGRLARIIDGRYKPNNVFTLEQILRAG
ncbi:integrase [Tardiphaga robiniae]|uniref:tyrosine-type recombinase/integrase n=1 Tax=Tardiphaga robiniae TaxID=943830 RepID=UPI00286659AA|nr:tyrosine-type recombinase/integrase [Tardiphaga robiniae]MDR6657595.1 integrase [Tardiphaga robiniae]